MGQFKNADAVITSGGEIRIGVSGRVVERLNPTSIHVLVSWKAGEAPEDGRGVESVEPVSIEKLTGAWKLVRRIAEIDPDEIPMDTETLDQLIEEAGNIV